MRSYLVRYVADVQVEAESQEEAIGVAIQEWTDNPDGFWEVIGIYGGEGE
jgi:hypothetical protein